MTGIVFLAELIKTALKVKAPLFSFETIHMKVNTKQDFHIIIHFKHFVSHHPDVPHLTCVNSLLHVEMCRFEVTNEYNE